MLLTAKLCQSRARFLIITLLVIVLGGMLAYFAQHPPVVFLGSRSEAACQGDISKISFKIHPKFYLNKKFLESEKLSDEEVRAYIEKHIRYVYLAMPAFEKIQTPKFSAIPYGGFKISQVEQKDASYPLTLQTSWTDVNPRFLKAMNERTDIDSLYMKKAVAAGKTSTTDAAILVSYEADIELLLCENDQRHFSGEVTLPTDPFLGFWFVPEVKRVRKFHEVSKKDEPITPCANDEFLYDHDPYYYWHYFALDEPHCKESLLPNAVQGFKVEEQKQLSTQDPKPFDLKFLDQVRNRELKATVNFTLIDDDSVFEKYPFEQALLPQVKAIIDNPDFAAAKTGISQLDKYDVALQSGLIFAWSMKSLSDNFEFQQVALDVQLMQWRLRGQLKQSQQKFDILVTMGSAMKESGSYGQFYEALNKGFAASDIVYFGGHSGVGKNLSENRIHEEVENLYSTLGANQIPDHQLLILMTCYSLHYFPPNGFPVPNKPFARDILGTASVPAGYDARILVGLMEQADRYLAKGKQTPLEKWPAQYDRDVFLVHQRIQK
jgi:hypothetical protein